LASSPPILELEAVTAGYIPEVDVLRGVSLRVPAGGITSIIGANGAGKSTVLRVAFGFLAARAGRLQFEGRPLPRLRPVEAIRLGMAYVAQGRCNFPAMTVLENLKVACFTRRDPGVRADVETVLDRFGVLREKAREQAGNLSGGQQQILEMAMALVMRPRLLLIDEPTLGLSPKMFELVFRHIVQIREQGISVLMVEQNAARALEVSDHAFVMELGRALLQGTGREILKNPAVREHYLGGRGE
jgi:branched-chain amino acid transport system ATP-binding protein